MGHELGDVVGSGTGGAVLVAAETTQTKRTSAEAGGWAEARGGARNNAGRKPTGAAPAAAQPVSADDEKLRQHSELVKDVTRRMKLPAPEFCALGGEPSATEPWADNELDLVSGETIPVGLVCRGCIIRKELVLIASSPLMLIRQNWC
jgi:hypothetical protein